MSTWWRHQMETFSALLAIVQGIHRCPVNSQHKGQWRGALMFTLICAWIKRLSKQSWGWWFETSSLSLWRHRDEYLFKLLPIGIWIYSMLTRAFVIYKCMFRFNITVCANGRWNSSQYDNVIKGWRMEARSFASYPHIQHRKTETGRIFEGKANKCPCIKNAQLS